MNERINTITVDLILGPPPLAERDLATGVTFTGYSPMYVGQQLANMIMQEILRAGERILSVKVTVGEAK